jgi:hypothetical protein
MSITPKPITQVPSSIPKTAAFSDDYLRLQYSKNSGHTNYTGAYLSGGAYGSVVDQTGATMTDYNLRWGKGFRMSQEVMLTPFAEFGHHEWKRAINYGETYTHNYFGIGGLAQYSPFQRLVLTANALVGRTYGANIDVAGPIGFNGPLGSTNLYKVGVSLDYAFTNFLHANIGIDYTAYKYGRSANYRAADGIEYYEPNSQSKYTTVSAGIGYAF